MNPLPFIAFTSSHPSSESQTTASNSNGASSKPYTTTTVIEIKSNEAPATSSTDKHAPPNDTKGTTKSVSIASENSDKAWNSQKASSTSSIGKSEPHQANNIETTEIDAITIMRADTTKN